MTLFIYILGSIAADKARYKAERSQKSFTNLPKHLRDPRVQQSSIECTVNCSIDINARSENSANKDSNVIKDSRNRFSNASRLIGKVSFDSWSSLEKYFYSIPFIRLPSEEVMSLSQASRGVDVRWQHLYQADSRGLFTCLFTKVKKIY